MEIAGWLSCERQHVVEAAFGSDSSCAAGLSLTQPSRACALCLGPQSQGDSIEIILSGRRQEGFDAAVAGRPELKDAHFCSCDIDDPASLEAALQARFLRHPSTVIVDRMHHLLCFRVVARRASPNIRHLCQTCRL